MRHFHNTTNESPSTSRVYEETNKKQDKKVLQFMRRNKRKQGFTSYEIWLRFKKRILLSSIRRALSNNRRYLKATDLRRPGGYGHGCLVWQVK